MQLTFRGVRGSHPASGASFVEYGGHTSCVSLHLDEGSTLILDAGTGLTQVPVSPGNSPHTYYLLISHLHWDHIQGFPFFPARTDPSATLVFLHEDNGAVASSVLAQMDGVHFPIRHDEIEASVVTHVESINDTLEPFDMRVSSFPVIHPGGALGFLIESRSGKVVYIPDNEIGAGFEPKMIPTEAWNPDLLIHDAHFLDSEIDARRGWGHSGVSEACELGRAIMARSLALFHHAPHHADETIHTIASEVKNLPDDFPRTFPAREGLSLEWLSLHACG